MTVTQASRAFAVLLLGVAAFALTSGAESTRYESSANRSLVPQIPGRARQGPARADDEPNENLQYEEWRPRRMPSRGEFPTWGVSQGFEQDVFTFVRIRYDSLGPFSWWHRWDNDYPDGDWNFSYRLQQLTSLQVAPNSKVLRLTDPTLFDYPFVYMAGVHSMRLREAEITALRRYLQNGGFVMLDDLWTPEGWRNVAMEMERVFPGQQPQELKIDHPIFHMVYDLQELPQVVDIRTWREGYDYEHWHGFSGGDEAPHFWAYYDNNGRMVALVCHNNDIGDGWEREGENEEYFRLYSERWSYPLGINIIIYAMSH